MKKILLLLLLTFALAETHALVVPVNPSQRQARLSSSLSTLPTRTQEADESGIIVTYNFSAISVVRDSLLYPDSYFLGFQGWFNTSVAGMPSLPETHDLFLLPPGATDISVEVLENEAYTHPYKPTPGRIWLPNEQHESYTLDNVPPIDNYLLPAAHNPVKIEYIGKKRNDVLVAVTVSPTQYIQTVSAIQVSATLTYKLSYTTSSSHETNQQNKLQRLFPPLDSIQYIPNPGGTFIEELRKWGQALKATNDSTLREEDDYLIISTQKYASSLSKFAQWKRECGHGVNILYDNDWTPSKIKEIISKKYEQNKFLRHVILAGSIEEIPAIDSYGSLSDYPYCCYDQSDVIPSEEKDLLRDLYSGRFFASDESEMLAIVDKIISYERDGVNDKSFYNRAFHVGFFEDGQPYEQFKISPANGVEDTRMTQTSEEIRNYVLTKGKTIKRLYGVWPYRVNPEYKFVWPHSWKNHINGYGDLKVTRMPEDLQNPNYWFTYDNTHISAAFNEGALYGLEITHGDSDRWTNPEFTIEHIKALKNKGKLPVIFSTGCMTGDMSKKDSFAKVLLNHKDGGAIAVFAHTFKILTHNALGMGIGYINTIWPNPGVESTLNCHENSPQYPIVDFSYKLWAPEDRLSLGNILEGGFLQNWQLFGYTSNKLLHLSHLFGDPGLIFPTEVVEAIPCDSVSVAYYLSPDRSITDGSYSMIINVSLPFEAKIGLYNKTTGRIERYYGKSASIYAPSNKNEYVLSIVKVNKLPYFVNITEETIKTQSKASLPQLITVSQKPGESSVEVSVDFNDCSPKQTEIVITDLYGSQIGNSVIRPDETTCSVKISNTTSCIGVVTLATDGNVVDATKINIIK